MRLLHFVLALAAGLVIAFAARAADIQSPVVLVAQPQLGGFYQRTVVFAWPMGADRHVGFILNRPTEVTIEQVYKGKPLSKALSDPVFLGGPQWLGSVFVVVRQAADPGGGTLQVAKQTFLVKDSATLHRIVEHDPADARFFTGMVVWQAGELDAELQRGFWHVMDYETTLVFRDSTDGLWEDLSTLPARMI